MSSSLLPPFAALRAFATVGHAGGVRKAAATLGVSHAIVSRHLATLEQFLGVVLFNRKTGELTDPGRSYFERISAAFAEMEAATAAVQRTGQRGGSLTIWCSAGFSLHWLALRLPDFLLRVQGPAGPLIDLRSTDTEPVFERGEADGDIRYVHDGTANPTSGTRAEELARPPVFPVASPAVAAHWNNTLTTRGDIVRLPLIEEVSDAEWRQWLAIQDVEVADLAPPVARYGQAHLALMAARGGQGVALANGFLVAEDLRAGRLVPIIPRNEPWRRAALGAYYFRCSRARWTDPLISRFLAWLRGAVMQDRDNWA